MLANAFRCSYDCKYCLKYIYLRDMYTRIFISKLIFIGIYSHTCMHTGTCLQIIQAGPVGQGGSSRAAEIRETTGRHSTVRETTGRAGTARWDFGTAHASCTEDTAEGTRTPLPPPPICETSCENEVTSCKVCSFNLKEILLILINAFKLGENFLLPSFFYN